MIGTMILTFSFLSVFNTTFCFTILKGIRLSREVAIYSFEESISKECVNRE